MYILKMQPMYFEEHKWGDPDAYKVLTDPNMGIFPYYIWDGDKNWWSPLSTYAATSMVKRGQYVYYSTKADNTDDPFYHWIGCTPEGNNSWIRGRGLHDYDCINYVNPGCTQRYSYTEFQYIPKKIGNDLDVTLFYGDALPKYLVLHGLFSSDCTVDFYNSTGGTSQASVVCDTTEQPWSYMVHKRIIRDTSARTNPEIPRYLKDTVFLPVVNDTYRIVIKGGSNGIGIKFLGMASAVKIGKTEGSSLSVGATSVIGLLNGIKTCACTCQCETSCTYYEEADESCAIMEKNIDTISDSSGLADNTFDKIFSTIDGAITRLAYMSYSIGGIGGIDAVTSSEDPDCTEAFYIITSDAS